MNSEKIIKLISEQFNLNEEEINLETNFREDLNADSLDLVELVMALEDEFNLEIEDEDIEEIMTVGDAIKYINNAFGDDI